MRLAEILRLPIAVLHAGDEIGPVAIVARVQHRGSAYLSAIDLPKRARGPEAKGDKKTDNEVTSIREQTNLKEIVPAANRLSLGICRRSAVQEQKT